MLLFISSALSAAPIPAHTIKQDDQDIRVCPARTLDQRPPDFNAPGCRTIALVEVDPQQRHLWLSKTLTIQHNDNKHLIGLLVSAKASSRVYLNGVLLGSNGTPGDSVGDETVGLMDTVLPIPSGLLQPGKNQLALRMSSHHGWLQLDDPIHSLMPVAYLNAQDRILRRYLIAMLPLGVFVLASFYFASMAVRSERKVPSSLLCALSALPGIQLVIEISRGVIAYPYPVHDLRLIGILICSVLFSQCLVTIVSNQFAPQWAGRLKFASVIIIATAVSWAAGMDAKASVALLVASGLSLGIVIYGYTRGMPNAGSYAWALALFGALNLSAQGMFLNVYFFYVIAALLSFLMVQQAAAYAREVQLKKLARTRADQLEAALNKREQAQSGEILLTVASESTGYLSVASIGKLRRIAASSIARIQGAGDYAELHLTNGESVLHTVGLNALEAQLPSYFLRVHRSHIINTRLIDRLQLAEGGTGTLFLQTGMSVPVSRRIMPSVRKALK